MVWGVHEVTIYIEVHRPGSPMYYYILQQHVGIDQASSTIARTNNQ